MSNLLEKASIILTPTAYNNGEALCVKPSDGSGDFDFSRNSAATRVNAQGLVENVQILSSNLVQNGDFSEEGSEEVSNGSFSQEGSEVVVNGDFALNSNWSGTYTIANGQLIKGSGGGLVYQGSLDGTIKSYKVTIDVAEKNGVSLRLYLGGNQFSLNEGVQTLYVQSGNSNTFIGFNNGADSIINSISCVEVGQNWEIGADTIIENGQLVINNQTGGNIQTSQNNVVVVNNFYKVVFTISDYISGEFRLFNTFDDLTTYNSNGTYTVYAKAYLGTTLNLFSNANSQYSITNISVKEVGQNWDILNDVTSFSFDNGIANIQGTANSANNGIKQVSISSIIGKTYKISATLRSNDGGLYRFRLLDGSYFDLGSGNSAEFETITSYHTATSTAFTILATSWYTNGTANFDISNITIIEISTDTNLPRINYEGFSYQDALGSELVVNGDFATDTDWLKGTGWTISGGTANAAIPVASGLTAIVGALTIGTTYKLTYTISNYSAGNIVIQAGWQSSGTSRSANGTYTEYLVCAGDTKVAFLGTSSFTGSIDNVSVKEYLGQEVVPDSGCGSWLFEPQSTNLVTQSELLNGYWSNSGSNSLISEVISPDGISFSQKVTTTSAGNFKGLSKNEGTIWDSKTLTISTFAKKGNTDWLYFYNIGSNNGNNGVWFNLDSGLISTIGAAWSNVKIETFGNGYLQMLVLPYSAAAARQYADICYNPYANNGVNVYTGDGTSGVYIWGAQIRSNNQYATSYIPTEGSTVTRNQDVMHQWR